MISLYSYLFISAILFSTGMFLVLVKKNFIFMLIGVELMFNAANINFVAFGYRHGHLDGSIYVLFIILTAACETAVGLAIILNLYKYFKSIDPSDVHELKNYES
ncbi:MAG: NADH-quinone oxidoreductase subunit NuoK [Cytophagales bacterium]|nr:NADH-quinone oxidoreductase subunit NuoK [Cytophagales bacterium]